MEIIVENLRGFTGFPEQALSFYGELIQNNNRAWFSQHKKEYQEYILQPAQAFTLALGESLKLLSNGIEYDLRTNGVGSILRIYRDIRFSKDKTPYKTHLGIVFWEGARKKMENPSFYFQMDSKGADFYSGYYQFPRDYLTTYRTAVDDPVIGSELASILEEIGGEDGFEIGGDRYKRVPTGYDATHPRAELLQYKGLWAKSPTITPEIIVRSDLVDACFHNAARMIELHKWLVHIDKVILN
jgi:uncharacterized protein (TIGR02453 family)